jgi:hypothetical protein
MAEDKDKYRDIINEIGTGETEESLEKAAKKKGKDKSAKD